MRSGDWTNWLTSSVTQGCHCSAACCTNVSIDRPEPSVSLLLFLLLWRCIVRVRSSFPIVFSFNGEWRRRGPLGYCTVPCFRKWREKRRKKPCFCFVRLSFPLLSSFPRWDEKGHRVTTMTDLKVITVMTIMTYSLVITNIDVMICLIILQLESQWYCKWDSLLRFSYLGLTEA